VKISTKSIYGLEALVDLAIHSSDGPVSLKSISERCKLSEMYILQIFLVLRRGGIVNSIRGAQGGYKFARDIAKITIADVLDVLEGSLALVDCIVDNTKHPCDKYENCTTRHLWEKIAKSFYELTESITIFDLVECYYLSSFKDCEIEYYI